eukprot:scaffold122046_cov84-Phaeocystis_antarctica.AAC.3
MPAGKSRVCTRSRLDPRLPPEPPSRPAGDLSRRSHPTVHRRLLLRQRHRQLLLWAGAPDEAAPDSDGAQPAAQLRPVQEDGDLPPGARLLRRDGEVPLGGGQR